ncbi:MAG: adenosylcobinamide amidohydrolase [Chloroflexota bacterium]
MQLDFPGLTASLNSEVIILQSEHALPTLASAVVGGGFSRTRFIINRHVDKNYHHHDPVSDLHEFARWSGIHEPFVGLMTAAYLDGVQTATLRHKSLAVTVVLTAGLSNPTSAGLSPAVVLTPGTINIILLVDGRLSPAAMVNGVITVTEAKADVLRQRGVLTPEGDVATGTSTDSVVVACTSRGTELPYAGPATTVGWLIGQGVRQALALALK